MNVEECRKFILDLYTSGGINWAWVARHLNPPISTPTVYRWLAGKAQAPDERWEEMYSLLSSNYPSQGSPKPLFVAETSPMLYELALEVVSGEDPERARDLATKALRTLNPYEKPKRS